jgi:hypothetical protein
MMLDRRGLLAPRATRPGHRGGPRGATSKDEWLPLPELIESIGELGCDVVEMVLVPTVNPKQLSIACESVDNHRVDRHVCGADDLVWASGVMCAEHGACVRRRSWAGYTINMFEFEFPTGTAVESGMVQAEVRSAGKFAFRSQSGEVRQTDSFQ